jgi:SOS response associated peptidase (SRAP)
MGSLERPNWQMAGDLFDFDHESECRDDRMPVILDPDAYDLWLDPGMTNSAAASDLLKPCDARLMRCYPISPRINRVANDDEGCSAPAELAQIQDRLFS